MYSGGLGVLAGDHLKAATDLGVPLVGVGLFYDHGYFHQKLDEHGWQNEEFPRLDPSTLPLKAVDARVQLELGGETVEAEVWRYDVGSVPLYLLHVDGVTGPPLRRRRRAPPAPGDRAGRRRCARARCAGRRCRRVPHQRGPRRLPRARAHPAGGGPRRLLVRRGRGQGAAGRDLHDAHARAGGDRPVPASSWSATSGRGRPSAASTSTGSWRWGTSRASPPTPRSTWPFSASVWQHGPTPSPSCTPRSAAGCLRRSTAPSKPSPTACTRRPGPRTDRRRTSTTPPCGPAGTTAGAGW